MNTRRIIVTMLAGMIVLVGAAVYFMIQSNRLSGKLILASKLIQEATKNNLTDNDIICAGNMPGSGLRMNESLN